MRVPVPASRGSRRCALQLNPRFGRGALPHPLRARSADECALQIVAAPFGEERGRGLVLHPLADRLEAELLGEPDQHAQRERTSWHAFPNRRVALKRAWLRAAGRGRAENSSIGLMTSPRKPYEIPIS
jgi:hypothetical protein